MLNLTKFFGITVLSTFSIFIYAGSAHAIGLKLNLGIADNPNTEEVETGGMGSFSNYYNSPSFKNKATTIDFNDVDASKKIFSFDKNGQETNEENPFIKYTLNSQSYIRNGTVSRWAPSDPNGERNESQYLQAPELNSKITIDFKEDMNYFGFNWGAISDNNKITFVNTKTGKRTLQQFVTKENKKVIEVQDQDGNPIESFNLQELAGGDDPKTVQASHQENEYNTFAHFFAETDEETFNQIIIEQISDKGGFEMDNHTFHVGKTAFNHKQTAPEPSLILGMLAVGGASIYQRRKQKPAYPG